MAYINKYPNSPSPFVPPTSNNYQPTLSLTRPILSIRYRRMGRHDFLYFVLAITLYVSRHGRVPNKISKNFGLRHTYICACIYDNVKMYDHR